MRAFLFSVLFMAVGFSAAAAQVPAVEKGVGDAAVDQAAAAVPAENPIANKGDRLPAARQTAYTRPDKKTRFKRYVNSMFGPMALGRNVLSAGIATWRNSPEEWGDNWEGFGRRVASSVGRGIIKNTTMYGLDEALKYDSRYYRSQRKDFGSRLGNALISPVTARNKNGKRVLGIPRIVGTYTGSIVAYEAWYPDRFDYKDGLRNGTISLGISAAFNVFKEFVWK